MHLRTLTIFPSIHRPARDGHDAYQRDRQTRTPSTLRTSGDKGITQTFATSTRVILDGMLASPRWSHLAAIWDEPARHELVQVWHDLDVYEDTIPGLAHLRTSGIVVALSNGNYRLLLDMAKNKQLAWDGILSTEFFGVYKPTTQAYLAASYHLGVPPERVAMVAAHKWDVEGAALAGLKTIYVPRPAEDNQEAREGMRSKVEGGSVDLVVKDFKELAMLAAKARK
ncbi:haloacid dehalogenase [Butyriboletus roseoflavus]|nr:haloacid dehalogenase [Butyriboletus roseoflavus]